MKIVVNKCYGGFGLSPLAIKMAVELGVPCKPYPHTMNPNQKVLQDLGDGWSIVGERLGSMFNTVVKHGNAYYLNDSSVQFRSHPGLVKTVETLGGDASGQCSSLEIAEVPDGTNCHIEEYDGMEHVAEDHRTW